MIFKDRKVSFSVALASIILVLCFFAGFYVFAQFYVPLDTSPSVQTKAGGLILLTLGLTPQTSDPTGGEGTMYYNSTSKSLKYNNGTSWDDIGSSLGTMPSGSLVGSYTMYYTGDTSYAGCRASWGEADCTLGGGVNVSFNKCKTGTTSRTILYVDDTVGPGEYPCVGGTSAAVNTCNAGYRLFHANFFGCFKN